MPSSAVHSLADEAGPFTFEEGRARALIATAVDRFRAEADNPGGAASQETSALDPAWNPADMSARDLLTAQALIDEAGTAGAFGTPGTGWSIELDLVYSAHGSVYQWRVTLPGEIPCSVASPQWQDTRSLGTGGTGADGALRLLRAAVTAANALCAAWRRQPAEVWLLRHADKHGDDITAHASRESALGALAQACTSRLDSLPRTDGAPATPNLLGDADAVAAYFPRPDGTESYRIWSTPVKDSTCGVGNSTAGQAADPLPCRPHGIRFEPGQKGTSS
jgi:hypothetical protein